MAVLTTGIVGAGLGWVLRYMIEGGEAADTGFETKAALLEAIQQMATPGKQGWLPKNHVFEKAVRECLRAAFLFAGYATSEELGEKKSYWEVLVESVRTGDFAKVPLTELRDTDERLWLAAYLERAKDKSSFAESSDADLPFEPERWIDLWSPDEDEEQAAELQEWLREWLESVIQKHGPIPQAFRVGLVEGFRPGSKLEGGRVQRVSLHAAFCLFLREKYRNNPPAYRQGVAETLRRIRDRQDEGQQEIIARLDALQEALPDADTLTDLVGEVIEGKFLGVTRRFDELSTKVLTLTQLFIDGQLRTDLTFGQLRRAFDALFAKMEESNRLLQEQGKKLDNLEGQTIEPDYDAALRRIAAEHPCTSDELKSILTTFSKRVKENPQPDHLDLAKAAYADKHFDEAATQADNAYEKAMERREKAMEQKAESEQAISDATENAIEAASFEAQVHFEQVEFEKALACRRRSAALVGIDEDPIGWAVAQLEVAFILHELARHAEAEPLMRRVVEIFEKSHGEEHPQVAVALNNLGQLLQETNRHVEAEPLMKREWTFS
ncbi:MAG: tetratricopeptide repeat protein [Verrucomicrobiota bacterium]